MTTIDLIITVTLIVVILLCAAILYYAWKGDKLLDKVEDSPVTFDSEVERLLSREE